MATTINWVIYPLKNIKKNKVAKLIGNQEIIDELELRGQDHPDLLGVLVDLGDTGYFLGAFITASGLINNMDSGIIKSCNNLINGKHQWLTLPFDDIDNQLAKRYTENSPFVDTMSEQQQNEMMYRLIWSMRVEYEMGIDRNAFVVNGKQTSIEMFETGDNVIVWMIGSQQIYGVVSKFGTVDGKVVLKITVTRKNTVVYNGENIDLDIGETVTAPIGSVETYSHNKIA